MEKVSEMTLEGDKEKAPKVEKPKVDVPLVGGVGPVADDSDSDSEPAVDIEDYELEEGEDPVCWTVCVCVCVCVCLGGWVGGWVWVCLGGWVGGVGAKLYIAINVK